MEGGAGEGAAAAAEDLLLREVETQALIVHLRRRLDAEQAEAQARTEARAAVRAAQAARMAETPLTDDEIRTLEQLAVHAAALVGAGQDMSRGGAGMWWGEEGRRWRFAGLPEVQMTAEGRLVRLFEGHGAQVWPVLAVLLGLSFGGGALAWWAVGAPPVSGSGLAVTSTWQVTAMAAGALAGFGAGARTIFWTIDRLGGWLVRRRGAVGAGRWVPLTIEWDPREEPALARAVAERLAGIVMGRARELEGQAQRLAAAREAAHAEPAVEGAPRVSPEEALRALPTLLGGVAAAAVVGGGGS